MKHLPDLDRSERDSRSTAASAIVSSLAERGVVGVAATFVDNSGITRVKALPLARLPHVAAWGFGASTVFDRVRFDDEIADTGDGREVVGDLRVMPDVCRVVPLGGQPGWAWTPADRYAQDGSPHPQCSRLVLASKVAELADHGLTMKTAIEIEWVISDDPSESVHPALPGPAYGMARLAQGFDYARDVLLALGESGVEVETLHPEVAPGQFEVSVAAEDPVSAADTSVLVRTIITAVGARHELRTSFSPMVEVPGIGTGGHVHLSLWRDAGEGPVNLMADGPGRFGLAKDAETFLAGILSHLPALMAVGAPSASSYLRLQPHHWAGAYQCWGLENREAAVRMITGPHGSEPHAANAEVKCSDLHANPYLLLAGLIATGLAGLATSATLPGPVDVDPATLPDSVLAERGIQRLPTSLREATEAFRDDGVVTAAYGPDLVGSIVALRESEIEMFEGSTDEEIAIMTRWQR